ncbi:MAG: hypothetical protein K0Q73_9188 [Paenibacillus sp.]|jgi:hypothetical protein|nr:hypothetical protein [Paenibacillus sp.]
MIEIRWLCFIQIACPSPLPCMAYAVRMLLVAFHRQKRHLEPDFSFVESEVQIGVSTTVR